MTEEDKTRKLQELYAKIQRDEDYRNRKMGSIFVPGTGSFSSSLVFIGEAPGQDEEKARKPFVGAAGRNLDHLLTGVGLSREQVYITNLVKYRPFDSRGKNRKPTTRESRYALAYLLEELDILSPRVVVCLGTAPANALLDEPRLKMSEANGVWYRKQAMKVLVSYHPSPYNYLNPQRKEAMHWAFEKLRMEISTCFDSLFRK